MKAKIQNDIPPPPERNNFKRLKAMQPGGTEFFEGVHSVNISSVLTYYQRVLGFRFRRKQMEGGTMVWRVK